MSPGQYDPDRDVSDEFLQTVESWIAAVGEVFVILRYLRAAGARDYALIKSASEFSDLVQVCPIGTDMIVFRDRQLPLRGEVTPEFVSRLARAVSEWKEYLYVVLRPRSDRDPRLFGEMGESYEELKEDLSHQFGETIAIGACPPFFEFDNESMISRSKGGFDGPR